MILIANSVQYYYGKIFQDIWTSLSTIMYFWISWYLAIILQTIWHCTISLRTMCQYNIRNHSYVSILIKAFITSYFYASCMHAHVDYSPLESVVGPSNDWISFHLVLPEFSTDSDSELASSIWVIWCRLFLKNLVGHFLQHLKLYTL
jgi:hypothetical protein